MLAPVAMFAAGIACIAAAVLSGDADVSLFIVFPVFSGSSGLFLLGTAMIVFSFITGFVLLTMGQLELAGAEHLQESEARARPAKKADARYGGVVLVGPVPIAFGSDKSTALAMLVLGIALAIAALVLLAFLLG